MKKIMDIRDIFGNINTYILIFQITNNIEKTRNKSKITIFEKRWGALDPLNQFEYFFNYDIHDQRNISL